MNRESTRTQVFKSGDKIELDPTVYNPSTIVLRGTELWVARAAFDMGYSHALNKVADPDTEIDREARLIVDGEYRRRREGESND